ncbi:MULTISPECIES: hypothetical protein [Aurantimonas]|uniref:hypothetical protein n=1 Tax=Aurantimonas TaxID=182269 RepID=UPI0035194126
MKAGRRSEWTQEETDVAIAMRRQGKSCSVIGAALGRDPRKVKGRLGYLGIPTQNNQSPWAPDVRLRAVALIKQGLTAPQVAERLNAEFKTDFVPHQVQTLRQLEGLPHSKAVSSAAGAKPAPAPKIHKTEVRYGGLVIKVARREWTYVTQTTGELRTTMIALPKLSILEGAAAS